MLDLYAFDPVKTIGAQIVEILRDTKPGLPDYFQAVTR